MGNQHSNQLNLKQLNKKIKQKSRINLSSLSNNKNKIKEKGSAFLCYSNGSLIANVQFKCNFCSTVKHSSQAIKQHYSKRHHFFESSEQLNEIEQKDSFYLDKDDRFKQNNCTLFIQDNNLIIRCSTLNYGILKLDESEDQIDNQRSVDQLENDLRVKRINELSALRQELTKLNAFSRLVESAEKNGPVRGHSIRLKKFDDDSNNHPNSSISTEDQLNNNNYYDSNKEDTSKYLLKDKIRKPPNSASDNTNSSASSLCNSDVEQTQIDEDNLFGLNDLAKGVEENNDCISETSSIDTTFGLDAKCTVCHQHNYVVCIQKRLGRMICANCFRFFRHFLSNPVVFACEQLGKCDLNRPIKQINTHASHNNQRKLLTSGGTAAKHVVKQQQLGIFKSKSNTLQSTPKTRRPLQQKELSFYSIASYSNNNSLNDQSKSMTLNLPSKRTLSPNQLSITPSPTHSNRSFALKYNSTTNDLDLNYNSNLNMENLPAVNKVRCNACWLLKCMNIYVEVQFDEKINNILNNYHPIQLSNHLNDELNKNSFSQQNPKLNQLNSQLNNQNLNQNSTLTKQKRYYTNNKLKSKSVSRLYYSPATEKTNSIKGKTITDQTNRKSNGLKNSNKNINNTSNISSDSSDKSTDHSATANRSLNLTNSSFNGSINDSNCNSINESNHSNNSNAINNINNKILNNDNPNKITNNINKNSNIPAVSKTTAIKSKLINNRSNSTSSNTSNSTINLTSNNRSSVNGLNKTKTISSNKLQSKNTITLNKLNNSINKPTISNHSTILTVTDKLSESNEKEKLNDKIDHDETKEKSDNDQLKMNNDKTNLIFNESSKLSENGNLKIENNSVRLILNGQEQSNFEKFETLETKQTENSNENAKIIEINTDNNNLSSKLDSNYVTKLSTTDNNLNLLLNTNIHNLPIERI